MKHQIGICAYCNKPILVSNASLKHYKLPIKERMHRNCRNIGKNNVKWKGDNAGYFAIHNWVRKNKSKKFKCESCGKEGKLQMANLSGKYLRDINDYKWLCYSCHNKFDKVGERQKVKVDINALIFKKEIEGKTLLQISKEVNCHISSVYRAYKRYKNAKIL